MSYLIAMTAAVWLATLAASLLALRWSFAPARRHFGLAVALSIGAVLGSYWGLTRLHLAASETVNGRVQWRIDSNWFFIASLVLAALVLARVLWKEWKASW